MGGGGGPSHFSFKGGDVGAVDSKGAEGIVAGEGTVNDLVVVKNGTERFFVRATEHAVEATGSIGLLDLTRGKLLLVRGDRGKEGVGGRRGRS